uniref:Uncharacterized protein n=1 Tax=Solanum lycopersicum TaxID=4081 RepID=A0A3Q7GI12_SOLLC
MVYKSLRTEIQFPPIEEAMFLGGRISGLCQAMFLGGTLRLYQWYTHSNGELVQGMTD